MKKLLVLLLALLMLTIPLASCNSPSNDENPSSNPNTPSSGSIDNPNDITAPDDTTEPDETLGNYDTTESGEIIVPEDHALITLVNGTFSNGKDVGVFPIGTYVELYAPEKQGEMFVRWTDSNGQVRGKYNEVSFYVKGNDTVTAEYQVPTSEGELYFDTDDGKTYYVAGIGTWKGNVLVVPDTYNGKPVVEILTNDFKNNTDIVSLVLPKGLITSQNTFEGCTSLNNVTFSYSPDEKYNVFDIAKMNVDISMYYEETGDVLDIITFSPAACHELNIVGDGAYGIHLAGYVSKDDRLINLSLRKLTFPQESKNLKSLEISKTDHLKSVDIPNYFEEVGIYSTINLEKVTLPDKVKTVIFAMSDITSITLPDSVETFEFSSCSKLKSVTLPQNITEIPYSAFSQCSSLTSIEIPDSVTVIQGSAFGGCSSLESINIPLSVTHIGSQAFAGCTSLKSITIPNTRPELGVGVFANCTSLEEVTLPLMDLAYLSEYFNIFRNCTSIKTVNYPGTKTESEEVFAQAFKGLNVNINYKVGAEYDYDTGLRYISIGDGTCSVASIYSDDADTFAETVIPKTSPSGKKVVNVIGKNWHSTEKLVISADIDTIDEYCFQGAKIKELVLPEGVTYIGDYAFKDSTITTLTVPKSVKKIGREDGSRAFSEVLLTDIYYNGSYDEWMQIEKETDLYDRYRLRKYTLHCTDCDIEEPYYFGY